MKNLDSWTESDRFIGLFLARELRQEQNLSCECDNWWSPRTFKTDLSTGWWLFHWVMRYKGQSGCKKGYEMRKVPSLKELSISRDREAWTERNSPLAQDDAAVTVDRQVARKVLSIST